MAVSTAALADRPVKGDILGEVVYYTTQKKSESLFTVAQKFSLSVIELQAANPDVKDPWRVKTGTKLTIPAMHILPGITRDGIVINLSQSRLYYFKGGNMVLSFPVAQGKKGWETPVAATQVYAKRKDPIWTPTPRIREENPDLPDFVPAGPNNPLGKYAISLGLNGIMLHGTNAPSSVGKRVSHGCMRMYADDIEALFKAVKIGTPVLLMKKPFEFGWHRDTMYLQLEPRLKKLKAEEVKLKPDLELYAAIQKEAGPGAIIDWNAVEEAVLKADGIPVPVAKLPAETVMGPAKPSMDELPRRASLFYIFRQASNP